MSKIDIDLKKIRENGLFLMVPAYGGQCFTAFARSMMQLSATCALYQIPFDVFFIYNESLVPRARNYCADAFLRKTFKVQNEDGSVSEHQYKTAMFIDADIEFKATDVLLLAHLQNTNEDYDVICGIYSKKILGWEKVKYAVEKGLADEDPNKLEKYAGDFVFNTIDNKPVKINQPVEIAEAGTGFMMFRREVLESIIKAKGEELSYLPDHGRTANFDGSREIYTFFDTMIDPESKRYLSEDYFFCKIARDCGKKIWAVPWIELIHHGYYAYNGSLPEMAMAGLPATVDTNMIKKK